jgi:hypothetical protein
MNIKNILLIAAIFSTIGVSCNYIPSDKTKTPTSPDVIENTPTMTYVMKGGKRFDNKRIYFDGHYNRIRWHSNNPQFKNVELVIYHKANWFRSESFEYIGTFDNEFARKKLIRSMGSWFGNGNGGLWCPEQNIFIGGTRDMNMCEKYAQSISKNTSKSKK